MCLHWVCTHTKEHDISSRLRKVMFLTLVDVMINNRVDDIFYRSVFFVFLHFQLVPIFDSVFERFLLIFFDWRFIVTLFPPFGWGFVITLSFSSLSKMMSLTLTFSIFVYMFNFTGWSNLGATYSVFGLDGRTTRDCDTVSTDHPVISMVTVFLYSFYHFEGTVDDRC